MAHDAEAAPDETEAEVVQIVVEFLVTVNVTVPAPTVDGVIDAVSPTEASPYVAVAFEAVVVVEAVAFAVTDADVVVLELA